MCLIHVFRPHIADTITITITKIPPPISNKVWYAIFGGKEILAPSYSELGRSIALSSANATSSSTASAARPVHVPSETEGIIFSNISSYGGGARLWHADAEALVGTVESNSHDSGYSGSSSGSSNQGEPVGFATLPRRRSSRATQPQRARAASIASSRSASRSKSRTRWSTTAAASAVTSAASAAPFRPDCRSDGLLEAVSVAGSLHLGQVQIALQRAHRLAQAARFELTIGRVSSHNHDGEDVDADADAVSDGSESSDALPPVLSVPVQADGEPLGAVSRGTRLVITRLAHTAAMLAHRTRGSRGCIGPSDTSASSGSGSNNSGLANGYMDGIGVVDDDDDDDDEDRPELEAGLAREVVEWASRAALIDAKQSERMIDEIAARIEQRRCVAVSTRMQ